jgi:16S rRNA (guanine527-N7)-methyltransferase
MQTDFNKMDIYLQHLSPEPLDKLKRYYEILIQFNSKVNLVSSATAPLAAKQHFADSVMGLELCLKFMDFNSPTFDMGSGNGFPGMVLGILEPSLEVNLVERDLRKAEFLKYVIGELKLSNISVKAKSIESLEKDSVSLGVTRALGTIGSLLIQMNSLFSSGGYLFHFKGESWASELANCPTQIFTNWDIQTIGHYLLPESTVERTIVASKRL